MLRGAADWLAGRLRMPAGLMLWLVGVLAFLALAGLIYWIGPRLVAQGNDLVSTLREQSATLSRHFDQSQIGRHVAHQLSSIGQYLFGTATTALGMGLNTALDIVVITLTTLYLAAQPSLYVRGLVHLVPPDRRRRTLDVLHDIARVLRLWVLGQLIDMVTVGAMSAAGLALLGVCLLYTSPSPRD